MREIKFRAWDTEDKEMTYIEDWYWYEEQLVHDVKEGVANGLYRKYQLMQYTGLKDKNGVEIYEGDIIKGMLTLEGGDCYDFTDTVSYIAPEFLCDNNADFPLTQYETLEVIGNKFENPELVQP